MKRITTMHCTSCRATITGPDSNYCLDCGEVWYLPLPVARVLAPWWRRLLARVSRRRLDPATVEVPIPEFAGGGSVSVPRDPNAPVEMPIAGPGAPRSG